MVEQAEDTGGIDFDAPISKVHLEEAFAAILGIEVQLDFTTKKITLPMEALGVINREALEAVTDRYEQALYEEVEA